MSRVGKVLVLAGGMVFIFFTVAAILWKVIPGPHRGTDYLVIGTLATFASLAALFLTLVKTIFRDPTVLNKKPKV